MVVIVTQKQHELVKRALANMEQLYQNNPAPLFHLISEWYKGGSEAATKAAEIISGLPIVVANIPAAKKTKQLLMDWQKRTSPASEEGFEYAVELSDDQLAQLSKILDAFSRIMMGQLHILFETMDIPVAVDKNPHMMQMYHDVYWEGLYGAKEAKDLLFPATKQFGWNGGYGIANREVAEDSRLAYQIAKAIRNEYALPVTDEPLIQMR